ncbi:MAG: endolytic transglycosylase MltG [Gemmatimonadales bacterium]
MKAILQWVRSSFLVALLAALTLACSAPGNGEKVRITIPPGATFSAVTDTLVAHDLVASRFWFNLLARVRRTDRSAKAGIYDLPTGASPWALLTAIERGRVAMVKFTAPEGLTLADLADLAAERLGLPRDSIITAAALRARVNRVAPDAPTLEGYLLPETYNLPVPVTATSLVDAMVEEFQRKWNPAWDRRLDSLRLTRTQVLALASIVEGEARHDDERPIIAAVYSNRLRLGMPLQADPTVQYAIQVATGERKKRLYFKDYEFPSPYNTYLNPGLPPGPVNSPGLKSIEAALYPADVPYLYFVAGPDGHHVFTKSLIEHNRAIGDVRRKMRGK